MLDSALPEINLLGEKFVEEWLTENGYSNIIKVPMQANENGLVATGKIDNILVMVRSFLHPHKPYKISEYEIDLLTRKATKLKLVAYTAYAVLDDDGKLAQDISWERLS